VSSRFLAEFFKGIGLLLQVPDPTVTARPESRRRGMSRAVCRNPRERNGLLSNPL
jgi:hypothetical protein